MKTNNKLVAPYVLVFTLLFTMYTSIGVAQNGVGINTTTPQAALDITSTASGILIPRMTSAQRVAISSPPTASLVYQTDGTTGFYYYNGSAWLPLLNNTTGWSTTGNTGTTAGTNFIGTPDNQDFVVKTNNTEKVRILSGGNFGIGTSSPSRNFHLTSTGNAIMRLESSASLASIIEAYNGSSPSASVNFFSFDDATDRGIQFNTDGLLANVDAKMVIMGSGKVGIGTVSPTSKLEVGSLLNVGGNITDFDLLNIIASSKSYPKSDGTVVGGWSANGAYWACPMIYRSKRWPDAGGGTFPFNEYGELMLQGTSHGVGYNYGISLATWDGTVADPAIRMRVMPTGEVGIGTTSPVDRLTVNFSAADTRRAFAVIDENGGQSCIAPTGSAVASSYTHFGYNFYASSPSQLKHRGGMNPSSGIGFGGGINFWTATAAMGGTNLTPDVAMTILNGGNVGIGTTSPNAKVDIAGSFIAGGIDNGEAILYRTTNPYTIGGTDAVLMVSDRSSADWGIISDKTGFDYGFRANVINTATYAYAVYDGTTFNSYLKGNGGAYFGNSVGIGTSSPGGQLELSLDQGRKPSTNTWTITSDERLKTIDGAYTKGLKEVLQLQPITYRYKNVGERKFSDEVLKNMNVGYSAQQVQKIFPEAVGVDKDGYLNFNMHAILVAYTNAIKEQQEIIENLKIENSAIKNDYKNLKADVEILKASILLNNSPVQTSKK